MNQDRYTEYEDIRKGVYNYPEELNQIHSRLYKNIRRKAAKRFLTGMGTLIGVLALCTAVINTSPVVAQAMNRIPVLGSLAEALTFDQGLQNAIKNDYVQEANLTQEANGYTLKLPYVIGDGKQLVLFFELPESKGAEVYHVKPSDDFLNQLDIINVNMQEIKDETGVDGNGLYMISMRARDTMIPQNITIPVSLTRAYGKTKLYDGADDYFPQTGGNEPTPVASYAFTLHLNDYPEPELRLLNQEVQVLGQPVIIQSVTEYPTGTEVRAIAPNEGAAVIRGLTIEGMDQNGNAWKKPSGSRASYYYDDDATEVLYYLENDYFNDVSLAGLEITGAGMFLKDERKVTVDLQSKTITPEVADLSIKSIQRQGNHAYLTFESASSYATPSLMYHDRYEDSQGNIYSWDMQRTNGLGGKMQYSITVVWPEDNRIILDRMDSPIIPLENPVKVPLPAL